MIKCNTHTQPPRKTKSKTTCLRKKLFQLWTHFHFCKKVFLLTFITRVTCNKCKKLPWTFAQWTEYLGYFTWGPMLTHFKRKIIFSHQNIGLSKEAWEIDTSFELTEILLADEWPLTPGWGNICFDWWVTVLESWWWQIWGKGVTCCQTIIDRFVTFVYFSITQIQGEELVMKFHWSAVFA